MAIKTEKELSETQHAHWLKAVAAIELRNFGYAVSLLQAVLKQEPEFLTGRQLLRRTEVTRHKANKKSFFQHLDRAHCGDESAAGIEKRSETCGGNDRESFGRRTVSSAGKPVSLEQQSRIQLTGESLDQQIAETFARHQAEPQNVVLRGGWAD